MALLGGAPDAVSAEEIAALSQCLEDETLLRLFLTGVIGQTGPLSAGILDVCSQWIRKL